MWVGVWPLLRVGCQLGVQKVEGRRQHATFLLERVMSDHLCEMCGMCGMVDRVSE